VNFYTRLVDGRLAIDARPVPDAPEPLAEILRGAPGVEAGSDRLLE
jgi:hypothetical protein